MAKRINLPDFTGDLDVVKNLIESKTITIDEQFGYYHETLLHYAARREWPSIVEYLVESGADIEAVDKDMHTPLFDAACSPMLQIVKYLVEKGANIHALTKFKSTPLHAATRANRLGTVKYLLSNGSYIDAVCDANRTPLYDAASWGYMDIVKYLLENGADKDICDSRKITASGAAARAGNEAVASYIDSYCLVPTKGVCSG